MAQVDTVEDFHNNDYSEDDQDEAAPLQKEQRVTRVWLKSQTFATPEEAEDAVASKKYMEKSGIKHNYFR